MFVRAPLEPIKAIGLVYYQIAHGVNANIIINRFNVGGSILHKYVDIVVDALISRDKLFGCIFLHFMVHAYLGLWMGFSCMWLTQCLWQY
jgi:hypothetical protein